MGYEGSSSPRQRGINISYENSHREALDKGDICIRYVNSHRVALDKGVLI